MKRRTYLASFPLFIHLVRYRECVGIQFDYGVQLFVYVVDPRQISLGDLPRRNLAGLHRGLKIDDRRLFKFEILRG